MDNSASATSSSFPATTTSSFPGSGNSQSQVDAAVSSIESRLDESGLFNDVTHSELRDINSILKGLSPDQTNTVISRLSDASLAKWANEIDSNGLFGTGGLSADERGDLFSNLASDLKVDQLARVHNSFDDGGIRSEIVTSANNQMDVNTVTAALDQQANRLQPGSTRTALESSSQQLNQLQHASQMARLSADSYLSFNESDPASLPAGVVRLDLNNLQAELGISNRNLVHEGSGFAATVYRVGSEQDTQYAVAFRGTEDWTDWKTNGASAFMITRQFEMASTLVKKIENSVGEGNVMVTGHSLGGGLSNYAGLSHGVESTTFNAKGTTLPELLNTGDIFSFQAAKLAVNYQVNGEILTGVQENTTVMFEAPGPKVKIPAIRPDGQEGNMFTEAVTEVLLTGIPVIGSYLAGKHDISGPIDRHGMDYVERGVSTSLEATKNESISQLLTSYTP